MASRDPLLPNAGIIARREYRDRVRGPLYLASTVILMGLALLVALAPIGIRYFDRGTVTRIAVVSSDGDLAQRAVAVADSLLNVPPSGVDPSTWQKPFLVEGAASDEAAETRLRGRDRWGDGRRAPADEAARRGLPDERAIRRGPQPAGWIRRGCGRDPGLDGRPADDVAARSVPDAGLPGRADQHADRRRRPAAGSQQTASRGFLGIVFVVLLFMTVVIYGMWVATGVAAEKSSRVMELMISAASPRQMLTGKVVGIGAAGLTQYLAIAVPALIVLALQDQIAEAVLGPGWGEGAPLVGLTPMLLAGYGVFFLLGFGLFALIYAAMGSFVSRPDDLQTLSLPLSLVAIVGYLSAIVALSGGGGALGQDRLVRAAVQPVRHARPGHGRGGATVGAGALDRPAGGGHRGRHGRGDPDVCGGGAPVRAATGDSSVRGGGAAGRIGRSSGPRPTDVLGSDPLSTNYKSSSGSRLISASTGADGRSDGHPRPFVRARI